MSSTLLSPIPAPVAVAVLETPRGWGLLGVAYALTLASMAQVGVVAAMTTDLAHVLGIEAAAVGLALALFSLPSAVLALPCGALVDALGARGVIVASGLMGALADGLAMVRVSPFGFDAALLLAGVAFTGISVAAPAYLAAAYQGARQVRAMAFWSTYGPAGFALGLLMGAPFAETGHWMAPLALHGGLMALLALAGLALPALATAPLAGGPLTGGPGVVKQAWQAMRRPAVLRLALAVAVPSALSYGTSLVAPAYLARVHHASMAESATVVAAAKGLAMMLGGLAAGAVLTRRGGRRALFWALAALGVATQFLLFWPGGGFVLATLALFGWLLAYSGLGAVAMAQLPLAAGGEGGSQGAASGVVGQAISLLSFLAPSIYFGMSGWGGYVLLALGGLVLAALALPVAEQE